jgi:competence protein ComEC
MNPLWGLITAPFFMLGAAYLYWRGKSQPAGWLLLGFFCLCGWFWTASVDHTLPLSLGPYLGHYVQVTGRLDRLPEVYENRIVYTLAQPLVVLGDEQWRGRILIQISCYLPVQQASGSGTTNQTAGISEEVFKGLPGDILHVSGKLDLPPPAANPGDFDYRSYLARQGIPVVVQARALPEMQPGRSVGWALQCRRLLAAGRLRIEESLTTTLPRSEADFLKGFLLGSKTGMTPEDKDIYQRTGVMHLFAVSGLNLAFVMIFFLALGRFLHLSRRSTWLLVVAGLWGYAALIDFPPSMTRAAVMGTIGAAAYLWQQHPHPLNSLALTGLLILIADPWSLLDPGFQLSFAATWGIIYLTGPLVEIFPLPKGLSNWLAVPLAAQLAIIPFSALYFQLIPLLSLTANLLVVPVAGLVTNLGLAGMLLSLLQPGLGIPFYQTAGATSGLIKWALAILAKLPGGTVSAPTPAWWLVGGWLALLWLWGWSIRNGFTVRFPHFRYQARGRRWQVVALLGLFLAGLLMIWGTGWPNGSGRLRVTFINVGQGDSILVQTPNDRVMLLDCGGKQAGSPSTFDPGAQIVAPYLGRLGIKKIDLLVNSHPHEDHLGGMPAVMQKIPVGELVAAVPGYPSPLWLQVVGIARDKQIPLATVRAGASINLDPGVEISVLGPPEDLFKDTHSDQNNNSLVLSIKYGKTTFLLTGDVEKEALTVLAASYADELAATVLKLPHHGSLYGIEPAFAEAVHPQFAVISVGKNNFGHPAPETLQFWRELGVKVLRTDEQGAIIFESDGVNLSVSTSK